MKRARNRASASAVGHGTIARVPEDIIRHSNYDGYLIMNARHIGSAWFMALRPENEIGDTWDMEWVIAG